MELRHLRYFVAVAEELHFGRAARRLHVVQSAVSQQVQKLEQEVGVELLSRSRRRVSLTEPGRAFFEQAQRILSDADDAVVIARRAAAGETGRLRVGYVDGAVYLRLPEILRRYRERHPEVTLRIMELSRGAQREALRRGRLDVGLFALPEEHTDLDSERVAVTPLVAALPDSHPLGHRRSLRLQELKGEPWILFPRRVGSYYLELVLAACAAAGFSPNIVQEAGQLNTLAALAGAGLGVTLLPRSVAERQNAGIVALPLAGDPPLLPLHVVWRRGRLSSTAERFLEAAVGVRDGAVAA